MLIDMHAHSSGISRCCQIPYSEVIDRAKAHGMDGIVLTNHYERAYTEGRPIADFLEDYLAEFRAAEQYGNTVGMRVFFGIEVTMVRYPAVHLLVYGVTEDFPRNHPWLFEMTQEELYRLVKASGGTLIQAHPFRNGATVMDPAFLDGVEINCHPLYGNAYAKELTAIAQEHALQLSCGGDYHADTYRPQCGVYLPDTLTDSLAVGRHLREAREISLCVQEPNTPAAYTLK